MNPVRAALAQTLASTLEAHAVAVVQIAPGRWAFAPAGAPELHATVRLTEDWLLFDAPLPEPVAWMSAWEVLAANATLPGGLKGCADTSARALRLRAEHPVLEQLPLLQQVQEVCAGLAAAAAWDAPDTVDRQAAPTAATGAGNTGGDAAAGVDLQQLCAETSWPFTPRGSDTVMVELDAPGAFQQAAVELQPPRGLVVSVPVLSEHPQAPLCEAALGTFLLRAAGVLRMVRAVSGRSRGPVCFEVVRASPPAPDELAYAFAALSLAWRYAGREAAVLATDERVAELYLRETRLGLGG